MTQHHSSTPSTFDDIRDAQEGHDVRGVVARVLSWARTALAFTAAQHRQQADHCDSTNADKGTLEREAHATHRRVVGLSAKLEDVNEVEYRQVRLKKVILVSLELPRPREAAAPGGGALEARDVQDADTSLRELTTLAETAGSQVLDALIQRRDHPDPATYLGSGKARELAGVVAAAGANMVIVDDELAPSQHRTLEDVVDVKVIDHTVLILDIFTQHAKPREDKAQVRPAQLEYLLPRLRGQGESMSCQTGGRMTSGQDIGSRGPGETKIELNQRRIRQRMARLCRETQAMVPSRKARCGSRRHGAIPSVATAGYTNADKSSLMNRLTEVGIMVGGTLFTTLGPTVRRAETSEGRAYTFTDTVGFVCNLPHELVEAFRFTLEEVTRASLVLHVVDVAHLDPLSQVAAVRTVLSEIPGALDVSELIVLNKVNLTDVVTLAAPRTRLPSAVVVSAHTGEGIEELRARIEQMLPHPQMSIDVVVSYLRGDLVSRIHAKGEIDTVDCVETGTRVVARVDTALAVEIEGAAVSASTGQRP